MALPTEPALLFKPNLQVSFYYRLKAIRQRYLQDALLEAVGSAEIAQLDRELDELVSHPALQRIATFGLRGELVFPVPTLLLAKPFLLGYYRLLYGLSQKEAYRRLGAFKRMEEDNVVSSVVASRVPWLCACLIKTGELLVHGIDNLSLPVLHDLQMLTLGPQFRGSENTRIGESAAVDVLKLIREVAGGAVEEETERTLIIKNAAGRAVLVHVGTDPDVEITEEVGDAMQPRLSIEIKGGSDVSNVHNRIGEAEKSHQKAKNRGFFECWTLVRAAIDHAIAARESPTTTRFFNLDAVLERESAEHISFCNELAARLGIQTQRPATPAVDNPPRPL